MLRLKLVNICPLNLFKLNNGLRQGDAIAPLLFNVVLAIAIRGSKVGTRGTIFDKCSQTVAYADDVAITGRRLQGIKDVFTPLLQQTNKTGLEISEKDKIYDSIAKALQ
jgi:hypothetical protein